MSDERDSFGDQKTLLGDIRHPVIIDGGAHVGSTAVEYLKKFPGAHIFSFEPFEESIEKFKKNIHSATNVELIPMGLSDSSGERTLYVNGYSPTNSLLQRPSTGKRYYPRKAAGVGECLIQTVSIDDFIDSRKLEEVHILKLDVQGAELLVLKGAEKALNQNKIGLLCLELSFVPLYESGALYYEVSEFLSRFGYAIYRMYDFEYAADGQLRFCNAIFLGQGLRATSLDLTDSES